MSGASTLYKKIFSRLQGKGFGFGFFNFFHRLFWDQGLAPKSVDVDGFTFFLSRHDEGMGADLRIHGHTDAALTGEFERLVKSGMTVLDLGANIGWYTIRASRLVGPSGLVYAFEPEPENLALLRKNVAANRCENVEIFPYAVSDKPGRADMHLNPEVKGSHSIVVPPRGSRRSVRVDVVCFDELLRDLRPDVVKMDIEGSEGPALRGMAKMLGDKRLRIVFLEVNRPFMDAHGLDADGLLSFMTDRGFSVRQIGPIDVVCERGRA